MGASFFDLDVLLDNVPGGCWAAIARNDARRLAYAATPEEVLQLAKDLGESDPIVVRVPKGEPSLLREEPPELAPPPYGGISDAWQAGNVVPFLGAGASRIGQGEGSAALPSSAELADFLAVGVNYPSRLPHERDLARISSLYENLIGRPTLKSKLRGKLGPTGPDDQPRNFPHGDIHKLIAKQGGPRLIVTTNYDTLIEDAFIEAGRPYDVLVYSTNDDANRGRGAALWIKHGEKPKMEDCEEVPLDFKRPLVFKMHGSIAKDAQDDSFVISEEDYTKFVARMIDEKAIPALVLAYLKTKSLLFLGYSLRDWNLRLILHNLRYLLPGIPSWAIQTRPSKVEQQLWQARGVRIFKDDVENFARRMGPS